MHYDTDSKEMFFHQSIFMCCFKFTPFEKALGYFPQISHVYFYNIFQKTNIPKRLIFYVFTYNEQPMDEFDKVLDEFDKNNKVPLVNQLYLLSTIKIKKYPMRLFFGLSIGTKT